MRGKWVLLFAVVLVVLVIECESKKIPNPYIVLGIKEDANEEQIRQAFKRRSRKYHPDRNKKDPRAKQKFEQVVNAYELLKDPERRRVYDQTGGDNAQEYQQQQGFRQGGGFGFPGGGFGFPGGGAGFGGINMEDLLRGQFGGAGFGGFQQGGHPGFQQGHPRKGRKGRKRQAGGQRTYSFGFGGQQGSSFTFEM